MRYFTILFLLWITSISQAQELHTQMRTERTKDGLLSRRKPSHGMINKSTDSIPKRKSNMRSLKELKALGLPVGKKNKNAKLVTQSTCYLGSTTKELLNGQIKYYRETLTYTPDGGYKQFMNEVDQQGNFIDSIGKGLYKINQDSFYYQYHTKRTFATDQYGGSDLLEHHKGFFSGPDLKETPTYDHWQNTGWNNDPGYIIDDRYNYKYDGSGNLNYYDYTYMDGGGSWPVWGERDLNYLDQGYSENNYWNNQTN